jgi:phage terminase large subunit-like protein
MQKDDRASSRAIDLAGASDFELSSALSADERRDMLARMGEAAAAAFHADWTHRARPGQLPPPGDWRIWLVMAGRGFGKTRLGAEWVRGIAESDGCARIALIGATIKDARSVMVEGESGLLAVSPAAVRPLWLPSLRALRWANGAIASLYGAAEPDSLRGPQHSHVWADEIAKWPRGVEAWDNAMMGLRLGDDPRALATTTPKPVALVRRLMAQAGRDGLVLTGGRTMDNRAALPPAFLEAMARDYAGTRLGRQ